jgi:hypothetical protein
VCESNAPATGFLPPAGFEDREVHPDSDASVLYFQYVTRLSLLGGTLPQNYDAAK